MDKLKLIIVVDNSNWGHVKGCLESLAIDTYKTYEDIECNIIVVNNGTPLIKQELPDYVYYINNTAPVPYGKAIDMVLHSKGFDSDTVLINPAVRCKMQDIMALRIVVTGSIGVGIASLGNTNVRKGQIIAPSKGVVYFTKYAIGHDLFNTQLITEDAVLLNASLKLMYDSKLVTYELGTRYACEPFEKYSEVDIEYDRNILESIWGMKYFNTEANYNIIEALTPYIKKHDMSEPYKRSFDGSDAITILEFGCDLGATLLEIRKKFSHNYKIHTIGIELNEYAARIADGNTADNVESYDIEQLQENDFKPSSIDCIIFGDVLEHLTHPERILALCRNWIKPDGCIIASIPNLMHISVTKELIRGSFSYADRGLLDRTHCHLFTRKEIDKMFANTGYNITIKPLETSVTSDERTLIRTLVRLSGGQTTDTDYTTFQYLCTATPKQ